MSDVTLNSAKLTITNHSGAWYYKSTTTGKTTCIAVAANTGAVTATGLTAGTAYTFSAYGDSGCTTANRLATAAQFTTRPVATVSNLSVQWGGLYSHHVGNPQRGSSGAHRWATAFTTGGHSGGYALLNATVAFDNKQGDPGDLSVKVLPGQQWPARHGGRHPQRPRRRPSNDERGVRLHRQQPANWRPEPPTT